LVEDREEKYHQEKFYFYPSFVASPLFLTGAITLFFFSGMTCFDSKSTLEGKGVFFPFKNKRRRWKTLAWQSGDFDPDSATP
jgi:hypothetical protein